MLDCTLGAARMPSHFTNRPRLHSLVADAADLQTNLRWEAANAAIHNLGGIVFMIGSVLFFAGGIFNDWRASIVVGDALAKAAKGA